MKEIIQFMTIISLLLGLFCAIEEGNILLPMSSNFVLAHSENKVNNKNYYTIEVNVGDEEQPFKVQVDTSVSTSWLPSVKCENCVGTQNFYDEEESGTSSPTDQLVTLEDEDGDVRGYKITDNFLLGNYRLKQYGFVQVNRVGDYFKDHYEGKLGLGYKSKFDDDEYNLLDRLKYFNLIKKRIFSINEINENSGILYLGDTPGKDYQTYCDVIKNTDNIDEMYKESWICRISHVGAFYFNEGIPKKLSSYEPLKHTRYVNFDSAYDYISVPISEKEVIENLLDVGEIQCGTTENLNKDDNAESTQGKTTLRNRIKEKTVSISCKTTPSELYEKCLSLSFVIQGYVYSIPLESLFVETNVEGEMEMLVKYIDDDKAIWTFGYPFMNQYLMIFNKDDAHVGIKKLQKTPLPIINVSKDWSKWSIDNFKEGEEEVEESNINGGSGLFTFGVIALIVVICLSVLYAIRAIKKKSLESNGPANDSDFNKDRIY